MMDGLGGNPFKILECYGSGMRCGMMCMKQGVSRAGSGGQDLGRIFKKAVSPALAFLLLLLLLLLLNSRNLVQTQDTFVKA